MILSGAQMNAPSWILASTKDLVSTFSRFQIPRRVCSPVWQGTAYSLPLSPDASASPKGCASLADVSPICKAMSREAMYSQALKPKPGSPFAQIARAAARCSEVIDLYLSLLQVLPCPVCSATQSPGMISDRP